MTGPAMPQGGPGVASPLTNPPAAPPAAPPAQQPPPAPPAQAPAAPPAAPAAAPLPPAQLPMDGQGRVMGSAGIPAEFVGKTLQEIAGLYTTQRNELIRQVSGRQQQQPQQAPMQQAPVAQRQQSQQQDVSKFWLDPISSTREIVQQAIRDAVAPMAATSLVQQLEQELPQFKELRPQIESYMQQLPQGAVGDRAAWELAHKLAYADNSMRGGQQPPPVQPPPVPPVVPGVNGSPGAHQMGQQQLWQPAFTEPSGGGAAPVVPMSAEEQAMAQRLGLTPEQYAEGKRLTYGQ